MDKKTQMEIQEQKNQDKFNNITQKVTPENQNQTHNSRKEGIQPINQKRWEHYNSALLSITEPAKSIIIIINIEKMSAVW